MITLSINNFKVSVPEGTSILNAARMVNIHIPTLCNMPGVEAFGGCRLCVVEIAGEPRLAPACLREVNEGLQLIPTRPEPASQKTHYRTFTGQTCCFLSGL